MDAGVETERLEETLHQHPPAPPARRIFRQILRKMRRGFGYPLAGERGVRFCGKGWMKG